VTQRAPNSLVTERLSERLPKSVIDLRSVLPYEPHDI